MAALAPYIKLDHFGLKKKVFKLTKTIQLIIWDLYCHLVVMASHWTNIIMQPFDKTSKNSTLKYTSVTCRGALHEPRDEKKPDLEILIIIADHNLGVRGTLQRNLH